MQLNTFAYAIKPIGNNEAEVVFSPDETFQFCGITRTKIKTDVNGMLNAKLNDAQDRNITSDK